MTAALKPLDRALVKEVRLDATHKIIEISPGVNVAGWTFGDQAPGPTIRARVGDKIRFTVRNRSDESVPGVRVTTAPMSPQDQYRSIAPRQTIEFEFPLNCLPMPNQSLSHAEIRQFIRYFKWADA